jgi:hypothetical protein
LAVANDKPNKVGIGCDEVDPNQELGLPDLFPHFHILLLLLFPLDHAHLQYLNRDHIGDDATMDVGRVGALGPDNAPKW